MLYLNIGKCGIHDLQVLKIGSIIGHYFIVYLIFQDIFCLFVL